MPAHVWVALAFFLLILPFLMWIYTHPVDPAKGGFGSQNRQILRLLLSLEAGFAAWFISGTALFSWNITAPGEQFAISGASGMALFMLVYWSLRNQREDPLPDGTVWVHTQKGCTFEDTARKIVGSGGNVRFVGFTPAQLSAKLLPVELKSMSVENALAELHNIVEEQGFPEYSVHQTGPVYELRSRQAVPAKRG